VALLFVIPLIVVKGIGAISWEFISEMPKNGMTEGISSCNYRDTLFGFDKYDLCLPVGVLYIYE
jgi:hypothetical protein